MKARVKATGESVTARGIYTRILTPYGMEEVDCYDMDEVEIITDPDYWNKLLHQYAGMAMQGIITDANNCLCEKLANNEDVQNANKIAEEHKRIVASICVSYATALIEKLQEEK